MTVPILPCGTLVPRYLCQSTSGRFFILLRTEAFPGDLVACKAASGRLTIRRYAGQPCVGVLYPVPAAPDREGSPACFSSRDGSGTVPEHEDTKF